MSRRPGRFFVPRCAEPAPKRGLSHCIRDRDHDGGHVFYLQQRTALSYFDAFGRVIIHCDLKDSAPITEDEATSLWEYFEWRRVERAQEQEDQGPARGPYRPRDQR